MAKKNVVEIFNSCKLITQNILESADKNGNIDKDNKLLDDLKRAYIDILDFVKLYLMSAHDKLYGAIFISVDTEINFSQKGPIDTKFGKYSDKIIFSFNPLYLGDYSFNKLVGELVMEVNRLIFTHYQSFGKLNRGNDPFKHKALEDASDASMASLVQHDIRLLSREKPGLALPDRTVTVNKLNSELKINASKEKPLEFYFNIIEKFRKKDQSDSSGENQGGIPLGTGTDPNGISTPNNSNGTPTHQWESLDQDSVDSNVKSVVMNAYNSLSEESRGLVPSDIIAQIKALLAPPQINWKSMLRKMVGAISAPFRKTRMRLNRRQPERVDLSGRLPKKIVDIVCAFDTSGSMSDEAIAYCMNEVFNIVKDYEGTKITIVECDARIGKIYQAKRISDVQTKVTGRGGTMFTPVIEFINGEGEFKSHPLSGKFKNALLVYFTDGYGEYEIPKPKTFRNLWVIVGGDERCLSLKEPYGDVKCLKDDKDFRKLIGG